MIYPKRFRFLLFTVATITQLSLPAIDVEQSNFQPGNGFHLETQENGLRFDWQTADGTAHIELQVLPRSGGNPRPPLIKAMGVNGKTVMEGVDPQYLFWVGDRDLEKRPLGWMIFFDRVPTRQYSVERGNLDPRQIKVSRNENRAVIEIDGLKSHNFSGSLAFIFYQGSPFIHMEARVTTERPATAFLYHVGLRKPNTDGHRLNWIDALGNPRSERVQPGTAQVYQTRYRSMALASEVGSLVISPFPHQFLYPLDFADNFGYNWAGNEYLDMVDSFSFGVRQPPKGDRRFVPWVNAPPGTIQKLSVLLFPSDDSGHQNLDTVRRYTRNDTFKQLPGYKTFTSHYHVEHSLDFIAKQQEQGTNGVPIGLLNPEFVDVFKDMGVDIVHLAEFHNGRTPRMGTKQRLKELQVMHDECARLSGDGFLLLPGEEPNVHYGGHWISLFPKPINWVLNRNEGQPFVQEMKDYGTVYHVGSPADVLELLERENGLAWTAHARIKSSTGYPDVYREEAYFKSDRYLGAAWKAMPADYSRDTMGWRVLDLLDDMANWGDPKYVVGEVDIFKIFKDYELFGTMNINYLQLDEVPQYEDGWQPVLDALRAGQFWVTTGEILIPSCRFANKSGGETLDSQSLESISLEVSLEWTYPLSHLEVVSGDGSEVFRQRIDLSHTEEFDTTTIRETMDLTDRKWARIEVWDIAKNGAFTQPVWIR